MKILLVVLTAGVLVLEAMEEPRIQESARVVREDAESRHRHFLHKVEELVHSLYQHELSESDYYGSRYPYETLEQNVDKLLLTINESDKKMRLESNTHFANKVEKLVDTFKFKLSERDYYDSSYPYNTLEQKVDKLLLTMNEKEARPFFTWISDLILNPPFDGAIK